MSDSNYCFLTYKFLRAGKVVWYSHLFKNVPQFVVIHTVKGFGIVSEAEVCFSGTLAFSMIQRMLAMWSPCIFKDWKIKNTELGILFLATQ